MTPRPKISPANLGQNHDSTQVSASPPTSNAGRIGGLDCLLEATKSTGSSRNSTRRRDRRTLPAVACSTRKNALAISAVSNREVSHTARIGGTLGYARDAFVRLARWLGRWGLSISPVLVVIHLPIRSGAVWYPPLFGGCQIPSRGARDSYAFPPHCGVRTLPARRWDGAILCIFATGSRRLPRSAAHCSSRRLSHRRLLPGGTLRVAPAET